MGVTQQTGQAAEDLAWRYLQGQGLKSITRNYRCRMGEIDLIMQDQNMLVFVEVRFRRNNSFGGGAASVTFAKQTKLIRTAYYYLQQQKISEKVACRFDVVAIGLQGTKTQLEWIKNAFTTV